MPVCEPWPGAEVGFVLRPGTFALTALLAVMTGIGPFTTDMYLPSLPDIARGLDATTAQVQLTISAYLVGFAVGQVIYGPFADRHGRKPVLLASVGLYCLATLLCALSPSIQVLIAARALQGVGGAGGIVISRAIVRDIYSGARAGREFSVIGSVMALAPVIAPAIGGALEAAFDWRMTFVVLEGFGLALALCIWFLLPETLALAAHEPVSPASMLRTYRIVIREPVFLAYMALSVLTFAGLFAWISGSSFVLQDQFGLSPFQFGLAFAIGSLGFMAGSISAARFVGRHGLNPVIGVGCFGAAAGGFCMIAILALGQASALALVLSMALYLAGMGLVLPLTAAGAMTPFPERAGAASSLFGFIQQCVAAVAGIIVGVLLDRTPWPLAIVIALAGGLSLLLWIVTRNIRRTSDR